MYRDIVPLALDHEARLLHGFEKADIMRLDRLLRRLEATAQARLNSFNIPHTPD
jgi:hypothetical protein